MKKSSNSPKDKQQPKQTPAKPEGVTELTDQDLQQVQGGKSVSKKWLPSNF